MIASTKSIGYPVFDEASQAWCKKLDKLGIKQNWEAEKNTVINPQKRKERSGRKGRVFLLLNLGPAETEDLDGQPIFISQGRLVCIAL